MCGIVGTYYPDRRPVDQNKLARMNASLIHRGPDGDGFHFDDGLGLGHRRLSIIDLGGGKQPLSNESGEIWITFNGEIYNYKQLRGKLEGYGHRFRTSSDTETIVHAYEEYGEDCLRHLRGMFGFAIWDGPRRRLFVARDRVGIKPLYYHFSQSRFVFASELKGLLADSSLPRTLDLRSLEDYLSYGYIPAERTIFCEMRKLLPGHYLVVEEAVDSKILKLNLHQYWDLEFHPEFEPSEAQWIEGLSGLLQETVKDHMISDVPLGAFLSGGMDSSCVVALMARASSRPVKTFSIGFEESAFNELPYARQVAEYCGTEHHELVVRPDAIELLPRLARQFDEPFGDSSALPTFYVSELARSHVTVALSGDGGDEVFAGYRRYAETLAAIRRQSFLKALPRRLRQSLFQNLSKYFPGNMPGQGTLRRLGMSASGTYLDVTYWQPPGFLTGLLHQDLKAALETQGDVFKNYFERPHSADNLSRMQYLDIKTYLPEDILAKVDRASMLCSLESRVPLLDHRVLEYIARVPSGLKYRKGRGKYIFRRYLEGLLPGYLLDRPKMGFAMPLVQWFRSDLTAYTREILFSQRSKQRGLFRTEAIEGMLSEHRKGDLDRSADIWRLLVFEHWCQHYLDTSLSPSDREWTAVAGPCHSLESGAG